MVRRHTRLRCDVRKQPALIYKCAPHASLRRFVIQKLNHDTLAMARVFQQTAKVFDETGDAAKSQGWSPYVLDTNGNGKRDDYVEPGQPADPSKDTRIELNGLSGAYAVMPSPT